MYRYLDYVDIFLKCQETGEDVPAEVMECYERWLFADQLIKKHGPGRTAMSIYVSKYKKLSQATVYRDFDATMRVFGSQKVQKDYIKNFTIEKLMRAMHVAEVSGDLAALDRLSGQLYKWSGQEKENDLEYQELMRKIVPVVNQIGYWPEELGAERIPEEEKIAFAEAIRQKHLGKRKERVTIQLAPKNE